MQKIAEMQKKAENARSISKLMQKKDINAKKRQKIHFQFRNSYKKIWVRSLFYDHCEIAKN